MQRIVVGIDGSEGARRALAWAVDEAKLRRARLVVVHAWHTPFGPTWGTMGVDVAGYEAQARKVLDDEIATQLGGKVDLDFETQVAHGAAAEVLVGLSKDADLLVVGARGLGGFGVLHLGSVSQQVAQHARCPVVIVRSGA